MTTLSNPIRFVLYLRVSSPGQVDGYGLDVQETDCRRAVDRLGGEVVAVCIDGAVRGTTEPTERAGLSCVVDALHAAEADAVMCPALSRLGRTLTVQEAVLGLLWQTGGRVFTADAGEVLADDPDDPMRTAMRQMLGVMNQLDRSLIVARMRKGRLAKIAAGGYGGGFAPMGRAVVEGALVEVPEEAMVVARMTDLRATGATLRTIAETLTAEGAPTKRGGTWTATTVRRMLARAGTAAA